MTLIGNSSREIFAFCVAAFSVISRVVPDSFWHDWKVRWSLSLWDKFARLRRTRLLVVTAKLQKSHQSHSSNDNAVQRAFTSNDLWNGNNCRKKIATFSILGPWRRVSLVFLSLVGSDVACKSVSVWDSWRVDKETGKFNLNRRGCNQSGLEQNIGRQSKQKQRRKLNGLKNSLDVYTQRRLCLASLEAAAVDGVGVSARMCAGKWVRWDESLD